MCWIPATPGRCCRRRAAGAGIDFSALIIATDFDGDATAGAVAGSFVVTIENDVPVANEGREAITFEVVEDALSTTLGDRGDLSEGNLDAGQDLLSDEASGDAGSLDALFNVGADEPLSYALSLDTSATCRPCSRRARKSPMSPTARR